MEPIWIALGIGLVATLIGWALARAARPLVAFVLALAGLAVVIWLMIAGRQAQGWDAIGYVVGAYILVGPAALGCALGGLIDWIRRRRAGP